MPRSALVLSIVAGALLLVHMFSPWKLDAVGLALFGIAVVPLLLPTLKSLKLPGGFEIELKDVIAATSLASKMADSTKPPLGNQSEDVDSGASSATKDAISSLVALSESEPGLALAGFRIEIEKRLRNVAKDSGIPVIRKPLTRLAQDLAQREVLNSDAVAGLEDLIRFGNDAAHGVPVSRAAVDHVLSHAPRILAALDRSNRMA